MNEINLKPSGKPTFAGEGEIQYLTDSSHSHEGGHSVAVAGFSLLALPDGHTTARKRSHAIRAALTAAGESALSPIMTVWAVIGALTHAGASNLILDGKPVGGRDVDVVLASLRLDVVDYTDGIRVQVSHIGGSG